MEPLTVIYKQVEGCAIRADVYGAPPNGLPRPAIVQIHGGALIMGSREWLAPYLHSILEDGWVVISIDYRLAPETKLPMIIQDLRDAFRWVREEGPARFGIDPLRIGVVGHSAGGYLTLMAGCVALPRPKALVSFYGYGDLIGDWLSKPDPFYRTFASVSEEQARGVVGEAPLSGVTEETRDRGSFYLYCRQNGAWPVEVSGFDPLTQPEALAPYCPVRQVTADFPPALLLHGDADTDVPHAQSVLMADALARAGVEHELITIPGGAHGFDGETDKPTVSDALARAGAFMRKHV